jgi:uridine kinase
MLDAFNEFHQEIETAYHFNGQQIVTINGNSTSGICYCLITLISNENGKKLKTTIGAIYEDEYIRVDSQWLVSKRIGYFNWQDKTEIKS